MDSRNTAQICEMSARSWELAKTYARRISEKKNVAGVRVKHNKTAGVFCTYKNGERVEWAE